MVGDAKLITLFGALYLIAFGSQSLLRSRF